MSIVRTPLMFPGVTWGKDIGRDDQYNSFLVILYKVSQLTDNVLVYRFLQIFMWLGLVSIILFSINWNM